MFFSFEMFWNVDHPEREVKDFISILKFKTFLNYVTESIVTFSQTLRSF